LYRGKYLTFIWFIQVVRQRELNAVAQFLGGNNIILIEQDASVAAVFELAGVEVSECFYQHCLAVKVNRVFSGLCFYPIYSDGTSAF